MPSIVVCCVGEEVMKRKGQGGHPTVCFDSAPFALLFSSCFVFVHYFRFIFGFYLPISISRKRNNKKKKLYN